MGNRIRSDFDLRLKMQPNSFQFPMTLLLGPQKNVTTRHS